MTTISSTGGNNVPAIPSNNTTTSGAAGGTAATTPTPARPSVCDFFEPVGSQLPFSTAVPASELRQHDPEMSLRDNYSKTIDQFDVSKNPRYISACQTSGSTYCSTFVKDVTHAMGAGIPQELNANGIVDWLNTEQSGWTKVEAADGKTVAQLAQQHANEGKPTVAGWKNPGGSGHVGMVRPGELHSSLGPAFAQAGRSNFDDKHVINGFGRDKPVTYWVHNPPATPPAATQE